ncbi:MAG: profilin, required for normal timing of actin polymerization in response to thermal stress [Phylliscum demangeonii]|nr:MAG: profilin, required for normal timing of actin polymerization in response to thermal stress [Phylliscum demangeonii]
MASWQAYVDTSLIGTGNLDKAAIFDATGTSVWAASAGFTVRTGPSRGERLRRTKDLPLDGDAVTDEAANLPISASQVDPQETKVIVASFNDKNEVKAVQSNGLHVGGERYVVLKADDRSLYGRKGKEGIIVVKTKQAILVTHYPETAQPGTAANVVEQLADYLIGQGY